MNSLGGVDLLRGFDSPFSYPNLLMDFMPLERYDQVDTKLLEKILSKQQSAGYWRLADLCEAVPAFQPNVVQSRIGNNANMEPIWATVVAQAFLVRIFPSQKNWWDMAFQKAKMWLASMQLPPTAASQFEAEAVAILNAEYERLCRLWDRYRDNGNKSFKAAFDAKIAQLQLVLQVSPDLWIGCEQATANFFAVGRSRYGFGWFYSMDPVEAERVHQIQQQKEQINAMQQQQQQQPQQASQQHLALPQPLKQPKPQRYQAINTVNGSMQGQYN